MSVKNLLSEYRKRLSKEAWLKSIVWGAVFAFGANAVAALIPIPPNISKEVISLARVLIIPIASRFPSYKPELSIPVAMYRLPSLFLIPIMRLW